MAPYFFLNLIPQRQKTDEKSKPFLSVLASISWIQWAHFFSGWLAWTCAAIDFFSVSLTVPRLAVQFGKQTSDITTAITLTLLLRVIGSIIFGILSDRYGRKWPLVFNLVLVAILQLGAGFVNTFSQFLAVRSLFGIGMGGIWGMAASTALENLPVEARGLGSGVMQQGYAVGYLLAACINLKLVPAVPAGWRVLFWAASGISMFAAVLRALLPESEFFLKQKAREHGPTDSMEKTKTFLKETGRMVRTHWLLCIYALLFMTAFNFLSHGSQDLYPTYLRDSKGISEYNATIATIIGNCGAIAGGALAGFVSQYIGRRLTIVLFVLLVGCFIPLWIIPSSFGALAAGAFCVQFGVQGAWGVVPIQLSEMSPPAFRATFPGVAYQLGNMVSSASAQIEATGAAHQRTTITHADGTTENVPDYAKVQGIFIGCVAVFLIVVTILGPEKHGSHFEEHKTAFEEGGGDDDALVNDGDHRCAGPRHIRDSTSMNEEVSEPAKESVNV
ncbi:major facilitator superfamily domain-containing protein [Desarmillaria tabescens]|uniref:Major facilitator superfamily domain-containing protein n=1 Tax=Armillaria tabescens TaxID=1929756 RepID=A0AA39N022_ARMTA|nr:major facilitator superfamily domain-containing protein [Desarmillaria tabescens]KAK0452195.1 major facilitator superfamily domain-containing protein [Desarmillaria tabescens]